MIDRDAKREDINRSDWLRMAALEKLERKNGKSETA